MGISHKICFVLFVCLYFVAADDTKNDTRKVPEFKCRLYRHCDISLSIKEPLNLRDSFLKSSNELIFKLGEKNLEKLNEQRNASDTTYNVQIEPVLVGKAKIELKKPNGEKVYLADVIVVRPKRAQDIVFDVYLWVYCGLMSFLMGILVDKEVIVKMLHGMQKECGLTFFCQFLLMPLVNLIYLNCKAL